MFGSLEPTAYDLRFSLGGIPVRVSPWFWLIAFILGYETVNLGFEYLLAWMMIVFVSILVHELGHALTARAFGYRPRILLHQFGGLAMYEPYARYTRSKAVMITMAGPLAGLLLFGLTWLASPLVLRPLGATLPPNTLHLLRFILGMLVFVNLWWSILNLLPVLPLDGGRICEEVCSIRNPYRGKRLTMQIGAVVAGVVAVYFFQQHNTFTAVLFALLCVQNVMALQQGGRW